MEPEKEEFCVGESEAVRKSVRGHNRLGEGLEWDEWSQVVVLTQQTLWVDLCWYELYSN